MSPRGSAAAFAAVLACGAATGAAAQDGETLFGTYCAACHAAGGVGTPGLAPPLARPDFWQALGEDAPKYLSGVVTKGLNMHVTVNGEQYMMMMPPVAGAADADLAAIATWVLTALGGTDHAVSAEDIAAARSGMKASDLQALRPETE